MPKNTVLKEMTENTVEALGEISRLRVCEMVGDATAALHLGAVLLAVAKVDNDVDGEGFRYLIGLKRGAKVDPWLDRFFG
jgi:hypothetical protein